ncbi:UDP-N-acetylhexosamine pyrophosphorylase-like protein [Rhyzopertha dominica]|nr:UDP-N-acetylhexosamine pyrophosphorylase-like protein [Rhyzopertha dominica]
MTSYAAVQAKLLKTDQTHLLKFWDEINDEERNAFLEHLDSLPLEDYVQVFKKAINTLLEDVRKYDDLMKPVPPENFGSAENCSPEKLEEYKRIGLKEIANGSVGVLLMAGGQGTRLGVSHPKGMYSIGLPSGKTLYQVQAERIRRVQQLAEDEFEVKAQVPWYIMTSESTREATQDFLERNNYFGLSPENVILFDQSVLPSFDFDGKIILDGKTKISFTPGGNGGIYSALKDNGILEDMEKRGIQYVHTYSVDNLLVKVADPIFVGYCVHRRAECGAKVVRKNSPSEPLGVICEVDGHFQVVEYSEVTEKTSKLTDSEGNLVFSAGNICNHFFTVKFLCDIANQYEKELKLHVAKKKVPYVDDCGKYIKPTEPNAIKVEKFIFDVFPFARNFVMWEVPRYTEFSALKNSDSVGKDCPKTAKRDLLALHKIYLQNAGATVIGDEVEISPLISYAGENLQHVKNEIFQSPTVLLADQENHKNGISN